MTKKLPRLSEANLEIMKIIWDKGEVTIADVHEEINSNRTDKIGRTSVQVQMTRLEEYGWLQHRKEGRSYIYTATQDRQRTTKDILSDISSRLFGGSHSELIKCLIEEKSISEEELGDIKEIIKRAEMEDNS